jgi:cytochrome c6
MRERHAHCCLRLGLVVLLMALSNILALPAASAADVFKGGEIFRQYCAGCHGTDGKAVLVGAPNFARGERLQRMDLDLLESVRAGKNAMPAFKGILTNQQILDVIAHLRTLSR